MGFSTLFGDASSLNRSSIYNFSSSKKPAELFRKDLISAMKLSDSEQLNHDDYWVILDTWKPEWEKGVQVPVNPEALTPNNFKFKKINIKEKNDYKIPKELIKFEFNSDYYESNYDLDLIDLCWLNSLKESDENVVISEKNLSFAITQLEFSCATNMNAKKEKGEFNDHVLCDVCKSPDGEDNNEMVFCDNCNICVHQACYGIKTIPSGEWFCSPCKELGSKKNVYCVLCPNIGGAFKPTSNTGQWSHVSCALWVPEVSIGCVDLMEPITKIDQIPSNRWNLLCSLCNIKQGTPIQCSVKGCKIAYHVTCAFNHMLKMKAIVEMNKVGIKLKSYCKKHCESNKSKTDNLDIQEFDLVMNSDSSLENNNLEFWQYVDLNLIEKKVLPLFKVDYPNYSDKVLLFYIDLIYQYWKIKRCSQYGAPLIKITTSSSIEEMQHRQRIEILRLRVDLERIRNLSYMLIKREKLKKSWLLAHKTLIDKSLEVANQINEFSKKTPEKCEFPTQIKFFKNYLRNLEDLNILNDCINLNNIYNTCKNDTNKLKSVLKKLNRLTKIEKTNEILKNPLENPYARPYMFSKREHIEPTRLEDNSTLNDLQTSSKSFPLKSKSILSNLKNSTHLKSTSITIHYNNFKIQNNSSSKVFPSTRSFVKKNHLLKSQSDSKIYKNLRNSPKILSKLKDSDKKKLNKNLAQENFSSISSPSKKSVSKRLNFRLTLSPTIKKSSNSMIHHKIITTRSQLNSSFHKL